MRSKLPGTPSRKNALFANLTLAAVSLSVSLVIVEAILRAVIPVDARRPFEFRIPDPVLGWVLQPNISYLYYTPEGTVSVTYNSQGWRDLEHDVEKPEGVFRILVLGDSFMEANSVPLEETFHRQLEELARASGTNVEVINMSVAGYGTLQEYLVFQRIGRLYHPDLVLVGFFDGNDVINNSYELASLLTEDGQVIDARPFLDMSDPTAWKLTPVNFEASQRNYAEYTASLESKRNKLTEKLILLRLLSQGLARIPVPKVQKNQENTTMAVDKSRQELTLMGVNYCKEPPEYTRGWNTTERIFAKFAEDVDASGGRLVVFTVPAIEEVSLEYMQGVVDNVIYPERLCLEEAPGHARLSQILTKLDIEQIALLPDFRKAMREDGLNLYQSDLHWSPEGHALAAQRVLSELIDRGFLVRSQTQTLPLR